MKAILVVETHKLGECTNCPMNYENQDYKYKCFVDDWIDDTKGKCPLKPLPTTKQIENLICKKGYGFMEFDELIDEILGGEE